jgi:hypothetical protein
VVDGRRKALDFEGDQSTARLVPVFSWFLVGLAEELRACYDVALPATTSHPTSVAAAVSPGGAKGTGQGRQPLDSPNMNGAQP